MNVLSNITVLQLSRALQIKQQIEDLESELDRLVGEDGGALMRRSVVGTGRGRGSGRLSLTGRRKIAQAQKVRWAKYRLKHPKPAKTGVKRRLSPAARARIIDGQRRRWAAFHAARSR